MANIDFYNAAKRHFVDAEYLHDDSRVANAGHLYGFAAECAIKTLLVIGDPSLMTGDNIDSKYKIHINKLHGELNGIMVHLNGRLNAKYYAHIPEVSYFNDWSASHRYYHESKLPSSLGNWQKAAKQTMSMLDMAKIDGVIP